MNNHSERRQHQRHAVTYEITVAPDGSKADSKTEYLHDISDGGISFTTDDAERYQIDEQLVIAIKPETESEAISLAGRATIVWIEHDPFSLNKATVGVQFGELIESENYLP